MDRRNFIKTLMASGVLGASPMAAQAGQLFSSATGPVTIVAQSDLPPAAQLAALLGRAFAAAGLAPVQATASAGDLAQVSQVAALLDRARGGRIVGVMDDAAGAIFQELAAARGAPCLVHSHHRFGGGAVRHCCTAAGLEASVVWSDALPDHAQRISRFYADAIVGQGTAARRGPPLAAAPAGPVSAAHASLVSFLITT